MDCILLLVILYYTLYMMNKNEFIRIGCCIHNAGVGGSSPPVATNSLSSQSEESEADSVFTGGENRERRILESQLCPTRAQRSQFLKQFTRLNFKIVTQSTDQMRVRVVTRHV